MSCCCCFGRHEDDFDGVRSHESQGGDTPPAFHQPPTSQVIGERVDEGDVQAVRSWREQRHNKSVGRADVPRPPRAPGTSMTTGTDYVDYHHHTASPTPPVQLIRTASFDSFKDKLQLTAEAAELWKMQGEDKSNRSVDEKDIAKIIGSIEFDASKEVGNTPKSTSRQSDENQQQQQQQQTLYMSSDSSTDEDDVLHQTADPVDLDEESAVTSRPEEDEGDIKPNDSRSSSSPSSIRKSPKLPPAGASPTASTGRLTVNSSGDDDELDAIIAAVDQARKTVPVDSPLGNLRKGSRKQKSSPSLIRPSPLDSPSIRMESSSRSPRPVSPSDDQSHGSMNSSRQQQRLRSTVPSSPIQRRRERSLSRSRQGSRSPSSKDVVDYVAVITPASSSSPQLHRRGRRTNSENFPLIPTPDSAKPMNYGVTDSMERLSDIPSSVDADAKERYLTACRILKSSLIEKDSKLNSDETKFLSNLLVEASPLDAQVTAVESAMGSLQRGDQRKAAAAASADASWAEFDSSERTTEQTVPAQSEPRTQSKVDRSVSRTAAFSQALSSFFSRNNDYPFKILGTYGFKPTVLTPTVMEALLGFFPSAVAEGNFVLKYALKRDGADLATMLVKLHSQKYTVFAVETTDGHVFGAFCSTPWRAESSWFGSSECFLWRLKNPRFRNGGTQTQDYDHDNEMEVYPHTGHDDMIQYCSGKAIAVGGCAEWGEGEPGSPYRGEPAGIGFLIDGDLLGGESSACATFANPRLGNRSTETNEFDIEALEVWAVTP